MVNGYGLGRVLSAEGCGAGAVSTAARSREELVRGLLLLSWSGKKKELVEREW